MKSLGWNSVVAWGQWTWPDYIQSDWTEKSQPATYKLGALHGYFLQGRESAMKFIQAKIFQHKRKSNALKKLLHDKNKTKEKMESLSPSGSVEKQNQLLGIEKGSNSLLSV